MSRNTRYASLIPIPPRPLHCTIIGVGAIGSHLAKMLAHGGLCSHLSIVDHDIVSAENLGPQGYLPSQIGTLKVAALCDELARINPGMGVTACPRKYRASDLLKNIPLPSEGPDDDESHRPLDHSPTDFLFICVDSMAVRESIGKDAIKLFPYIQALIDARMGAEVIQLLSFTDDAYLKTIFPDSEAELLPCSARATPHCPAVAAGLMHHHFTKFLRKHPVPQALCLDLGTTYFEERPLSDYAPEPTPVTV